jgi:hypothetical protein
MISVLKKKIREKLIGGILDKKRIRNKKEYESLYRTSKKINEAYEKIDRSKKKLVLGVTSGRSGMKWVYEIFRHHNNADGGGERNVEEEAFWRYVHFNNLPIDLSGVIEVTKREILLDWIESDISITVSPYFSHNFLRLVEELKIDYIIWGITDPKFTVTSFYNKGWYKEEILYKDINKVIGYQFNENWSHFLGRVIPSGEEYKKWTKLTRIGKISWFVNMIHCEIYKQIQQLPKEMVYVFKLADADQNYEFYKKMASFFGLKPLMSERDFLSLKKLAAKSSENRVKKWTEKEEEEFLKMTKELREIYENELNKFAPYV